MASGTVKLASDGALAEGVLNWLAAMGYRPQGRFARVGMPTVELLQDWVHQLPWLFKWLIDNVRSSEDLNVIGANLRIAQRDSSLAKEKDDLRMQVSQLQAEQSALDAQIRQAELEVDKLVESLAAADMKTSKQRHAVATVAQKAALSKATKLKTAALARRLSDLTASLAASCHLHREETDQPVESLVPALLDEVATISTQATSVTQLPDAIAHCFSEAVAVIQNDDVLREPARFLDQVRSDTLTETSTICTATRSLDLASDAARLRLKLEGGSLVTDDESVDVDLATRESDDVFQAFDDDAGIDENCSVDGETEVVDVTDEEDAIQDVPAAAKPLYAKYAARKATLEQRVKQLQARLLGSVSRGTGTLRRTQTLLQQERQRHLAKVYRTMELENEGLGCENAISEQLSAGRSLGLDWSDAVAEAQLAGAVAAKDMVEYHVARLLELETCRDSAAGELKAAHEAVSAYQKTASTKTRIIKWLITETDAVLSQINSLHASLKQDAVEAVANRLESVPLILQDLATSCDSELDIALNHVRATALIRSEGAASTDQSSPLVENLLIAQRKHDVNGPMKDVLTALKVPRYRAMDGVLHDVFTRQAAVESMSQAAANCRAKYATAVDELPCLQESSSLSAAAVQERAAAFMAHDASKPAEVAASRTLIAQLQDTVSTASFAANAAMVDWWELPAFQCPDWVIPPQQHDGGVSSGLPLREWMARWVELSHFIKKSSGTA